MNPRPPIAGASQVDNDLRSVSHVELGQHTLHVGFYRASQMNNSSVISAFVSPWAMSMNTSCSRAVSSAIGVRSGVASGISSDGFGTGVRIAATGAETGGLNRFGASVSGGSAVGLSLSCCSMGGLVPISPGTGVTAIWSTTQLNAPHHAN